MPSILGNSSEVEPSRASSNSIKIWRESLTQDREVNIRSLAYNYLGIASARLDPAEILSRLATLCMGKEFREAAISMLDRLDALIIGLISLSGSLEIATLRRSLETEYSYHEIDYRLANLVERLLVFRTVQDVYRANPYLEQLFIERIAKADLLFGPFPNNFRIEEDRNQPSFVLSVYELFLILYALCREDPDPTLKSGLLSAKTRRRIKEICPNDSYAPAAIEAIIQALLRTKLAVKREQSLSVEFDSLLQEMEADSEVFPFKLVLAWTDGYCNGPYQAVWKILSPFLKRRFVFSVRGLKRLSVITQGISPWYETYGSFAQALENFGILARTDDALIGRPERLHMRWGERQEEKSTAFEITQCSIDGSGTVYVMPGMKLPDLVKVLDIAKLCQAGETWKFEITKESSRRAFTDGWTQASIEEFLKTLSGRTIPQTLAFDLGSWKRQFDSARLYKGYVLALADSLEDITEKSKAFAKFEFEKIGEGLYFFGSGVHGEEIIKAMTKVGLPVPSLLSSVGDKKKHKKRRYLFSDHEDAIDQSIIPLLHSAFESKTEEIFGIDNKTQTLFLDEIAQLNIDSPIMQTIVGKIERKLVYTKKQLRDMVDRDMDRIEKTAEFSSKHRMPRPSSPCAGGLDFGGKLRIIQSALDSKYSTLEIKWKNGENSETNFVRPTSLRKTEGDWELEGEDIASGKPISFRVGSISLLCREKGFFLGET